MAGFGFVFEYEEASAGLVRRLLRHSQRQARHFGLEFRYRVKPARREFLVIVDGPLRGMQALGTRLWTELLLLAEWAERPKPALRRIDAAYELLWGYAEGLRGITALVHSKPKLMTRTALPRYEDEPYIPESIIFDRELIPLHLRSPLRTFETVLALYQNLPENAAMIWPPARIEVELVVEEAHTATELMMRQALGQATGSYQQMADEVHRRGWINAGQRTLLVQLKNLRKRVKHSGQGVGSSADGLFQLIMNAAACCHLLLERLPRGEATSWEGAEGKEGSGVT